MYNNFPYIDKVLKINLSENLLQTRFIWIVNNFDHFTRLIYNLKLIAEIIEVIYFINYSDSYIIIFLHYITFYKIIRYNILKHILKKNY